MRAAVGCDLDGVIWRGDDPIPGSAAAIAALRAAGVPLAFVTNNSNATVETYGAKLGRCGIAVEPYEIITSAMAAAHFLRTELPPSATVLACAGGGVREALTAAGFAVVDNGPADAVVVGWHKEFDFERLRIAADAIRGGARFVATNTDPTYPGANGTVLPGNGSLVAAVRTASGQDPVVAGKPHGPMAELVRERLGSQGVMIGDRVSTDGAFAKALGWPFGLVLSGIAGSDASESVDGSGAAFIAADIAALVPMLLNSDALGSGS